MPLPTRLSPTSSPLTPLPKASVARTVTAGVIVAATNTAPGCWVNESAVAAAEFTSKLALTAGVSAPLLAVSCLPTPAASIVSAPNVATPSIAFTVVVPTNEPVPLVTARLTSSVAPVTRFPNASRTLTDSAGLNGAPAVIVAGGCS